jgi:hypothetical protein
MIDGHVVVIGGGGHARVLLDALSSMGVRVAGVVAPSIAPGLRAPLLGDDSWLLEQDAGKVLLVNALGSTSNTAARAAVFDRFRSAGFRFATVVHRAAIVAADATLGEGAQVMAGAIVQPGVVLAENVLVNTGAHRSTTIAWSVRTRTSRRAWCALGPCASATACTSASARS